MRAGRGWQRVVGGGEYDGEWLAGLRHGKGTLTEGTTITKGRWAAGELQANEPHHVSCTFDDGAQYRGGWMAGKQHGRGRLVQQDGDWLEGYFEAGELAPERRAHGARPPRAQPSPAQLSQLDWRHRSCDSPRS